MNSRKFDFTIEPWNISQERLEYTTKIFKLLIREMKLDSENVSADFAVIESADWINVLPITADNEVILVEQYRFGISAPTLEIPGGIIDAGEDPMESAKRELLEETGFAGGDWESLGSISSNPAIFSNFTHFFLCRNCEKVSGQNLDLNERIHVHQIPMDEFLQMVRDGVIHHSLTVAAVAKFLLLEAQP